MNNLLLGTSGWTYDHWVGRFYSRHMPKKRWFEFFCSVFPTVEVNASFYRIPALKTVEGWSSRSPERFRFSIKMSRLVTHVKKLRNCESEIQWYFANFEPLRAKIACILVQLPPALKFDEERFVSFSDLLPQEYHFAFEFRNATWYNDRTYRLLQDRGFSFCVHDMNGLETERIVSSETVYIRFHGHNTQYGGDYPDSVLENWAAWIKKELRSRRQILGYFNNDIEGFAIKNCLTLRKMLGEQISQQLWSQAA